MFVRKLKVFSEKYLITVKTKCLSVYQQIEKPHSNEPKGKFYYFYIFTYLIKRGVEKTSRVSEEENSSGPFF